MVSAAIFHTVFTELVIGAYAVASLGALVRTAATVVPSIGTRINEGWRATLDGAALVGAMFGTAMVPLAAFSGLQSAPTADIASPLLVNKMMLSGFALGLWVGFLHGRWTIGPSLWENRGLALLHGGLALAGFQVIVTIASLGGLFGRGETLLDLVPFLPHFDGASTLGIGASAALFIISLTALLVVFFVQPKADNLKA